MNLPQQANKEEETMDNHPNYLIPCLVALNRAAKRGRDAKNKAFRIAFLCGEDRLHEIAHEIKGSMRRKYSIKNRVLTNLKSQIDRIVIDNDGNVYLEYDIQGYRPHQIISDVREYRVPVVVLSPGECLKSHAEREYVLPSSKMATKWLVKWTGGENER